MREVYTIAQSTVNQIRSAEASAWWYTANIAHDEGGSVAGQENGSVLRVTVWYDYI